MVGETKKDKKPHARTSSDLKTEEVIQALVLADSFDQRFAPISLETPRVIIFNTLFNLFNLMFVFCITGITACS